MTTKQTKYEQMAADGAVDAAMLACEEDIESFERQQDVLRLADALHGKAMILDWYLSQYEQCIVSLQREIEIREEHKLDGQDAAYLRLGIVHMFLGQDDVVLAYMTKVLDLDPSNKVKATALNVIGDTVFKTKPQEAEQCFLESETLFREGNDTYNLSHVRLSSARLEGWKGNYDHAIEICKVELESAQQVDSQGIIGTAYLRFSEVYSYQESADLVREYAQKAYDVGMRNNWKILCDEAMDLMT